jgi:hypothetical protein
MPRSLYARHSRRIGSEGGSTHGSDGLDDGVRDAVSRIERVAGDAKGAGSSGQPIAAVSERKVAVERKGNYEESEAEYRKHEYEPYLDDVKSASYAHAKPGQVVAIAAAAVLYESILAWIKRSGAAASAIHSAPERGAAWVQFERARPTTRSALLDGLLSLSHASQARPSASHGGGICRTSGVIGVEVPAPRWKLRATVCVHEVQITVTAQGDSCETDVRQNRGIAPVVSGSSGPINRTRCRSLVKNMEPVGASEAQLAAHVFDFVTRVLAFHILLSKWEII